ncbi:MAG: hypothetical protein ABSB84_14105 [Verrucomicrobiota bacterium]|jgi:hypothetical protein
MEPVEEKTTMVGRPNLMRVACIIFAVWTGAAIFSSRCLYADGAHEFVKVLQTQDFFSTMWSRHFAFYIYEFPLVLAIKLGVTNLAWLRLAFGLGRFLPWPLVLLGCRWLSPKHFWLAVVGCAAGYLNAAFTADGAHNLAHAFFWPSLFAILFARPLKPLAAVMLLVSAAAMLYSYESQLFLCLPLALLASWRSGREKQEGHRIWVVFLTAAVFFFAGATIGLRGILMPEIYSCFASFKASTWGMLGHMGWTLTWTTVWACLALAVWFSKTVGRIISHQAAIGLLLAGLVVWGIWPLLRPDRLDTARQYDNRALDMFVPLALLPVALILRLRPQWIEPRRAQLVQLAAGLLMAQSLWQLNATWQWQADVGKLQGVLSSRRGIVPLHASILGTSSMESRALDFDWTWPCLSIALNPGPQIHSLVCSESYTNPRHRDRFWRDTFWQPFDPLEVKTLPDLRHYGLDFSDYISALNSDHPGK